MQLTNSALSMLLKRYRAVLFKCRTLNWLGGTVLAAGLVLGAASGAQAALPDESWVTWNSETETTNPATPDWQTKGLKITEGANITLTDAHGYAGIALQMDGGTVTIAGGDGTSWYTPSLFGYGAEADANDATPAATTLSGGTVNIVRGSFGAGLTGDGAQTKDYQFNIAGGNVNFQGARQYDAVMLVTSTATAKTALAISDGAVTVAAGKFGAIDAPHGNVAVTGTGSLNAQGQLDLIAGGLAADGSYTPTNEKPANVAISGGGTLTVGSQGALNLHQAVTLAVASDGVLRNAGTINVGVEGVENATLDLSTVTNPLDALIGDGGSVVVAGTEERSRIRVSDLAISTDQLAASRTAGKIALGPKGGISASGTLTLSGSTLALGVKEGAAGRLHTKTLTLADDITLAAGQIRLGGSGAALNGNLTLNNADARFAELRLGSNEGTESGTIDGNVTAASGTVAVNQGTWTLAAGKTLDIAAGSTLAIGTETPDKAAILDVQGTLTNAGALTMGKTGATDGYATLQASNGGHADLTQGTVTVGEGSAFAVASGGHMKFSEANLKTVVESDAASLVKINQGMVSVDAATLTADQLKDRFVFANGGGVLKVGTLNFTGDKIEITATALSRVAVPNTPAIWAGEVVLDPETANGPVTLATSLTLTGDDAALSVNGDGGLKVDGGSLGVDGTANIDTKVTVGDTNAGSVAVADGGNATFAQDVTVDKGTVTVAQGGTATVGNGATLKFDGAANTNAKADIQGTLDVTGGTLETTTGADVKVAAGGVVKATADSLGVDTTTGVAGNLGQALTVAGGGVVDLNLGENASIAQDKLATLASAIGAGAADTGLLDLGDAEITGVTADTANKTIAAGEAAKLGNVTTDAFREMTVTGVKADGSDNLSGAYAAIELDTGETGPLTITKNLTLLGGADGNKLISEKDSGTVAGASIGTTTLTLGDANADNSGTLGDVAFTGDGTLNVLGDGKGDGVFSVEGDIAAGTADNGTVTVQGTTLKADSIGDASNAIKALNVSNGKVDSEGAIDTKGLTATGGTIAANGNVTVGADGLTLNGSSVTGAGDLTSGGDTALTASDIEREGDIDLSAGDTTVADGSKIAATGGDVALAATTMNGGSITATAKDDGTKGDVTVGGVLTVQSGENAITAKDGTVSAAENVAVTGGSLAMQGKAITVADTKTVTTAADSSLSMTANGGDLTLGGAVTAADGSTLALAAKAADNTGGNIIAKDDVTASSLVADGDITAAAAGTGPGDKSITAPVVQAGGTIDVNDLTATGDPDAKDASVKAGTLTAANDVVVSNGALELGAGDSTVGNDLTLTDVKATVAGKLDVTNDVTVTNGTFDLKDDSTVGNDLTLTNADASVAGKLDVTGATTIDGGTFTGAEGSEVTYTGGATVKGGAAQTYDTLTVAGTGLAVGDPANDTSKTSLGVTALNLSGKSLTVGGADNAPAMVAVESFTNGADPAETKANGDITVNKNGQFSYGTADTGYAAQQMAVAAANGMDTAGVSSVFAVAGATPLDMGGKALNVGEPASPVTGADAAIGANTLTIVSAAAAKLTDGAGGAVNIGANAADVGENAKLFIPDAQIGSSYAVFNPEATVTLADTAWTGANLAGDNPLVTLARNDNGVINANLNSAGNVMPKLDPELVDAINAAAVAHQIGTGEQFVNSPEKGVRFLSRAISPKYLDAAANPDLAAQTIEGAARMVTIGAVPQMTRAANQAAGEAVTQRTSLAQPTGIQTQEAGDHFALWIMPLYQSVNGFGMEAGNFDADFNGGLGGVAIGADYTFENAIRAGITFNIGGGYATGGGDFADTTNSMNFWGIGAYAGWTKNNFGLAADVNFTSAYNKLEQDLPSAMGMRDLKADVRSYAFSTGLRGEYKLETDVLDIIPHVGVRYMYLSTEDYKVKSEGTVLKGDGLNQNIWTFPVGVSFSRSIDTGNGWHFKPMVDLSVIPAAGDIKARENVRFTGTDTQAELETQIMDYISYQGGLGFEVGNENLAFGVNGNVQFGAKTSGYGVLGTFRYEF